MVGSTLSAVVVASLVAVGVGALVAPARASAQYGIVLDDPRALAFVRAMGVRDLVLGGLLGLLLYVGARVGLGCGLVLTAIVATVDLAVVRADARRMGSAGASLAVARLVHGAGALMLLAVGITVLAGY
jgi:hypothetical protein